MHYELIMPITILLSCSSAITILLASQILGVRTWSFLPCKALTQTIRYAMDPWLYYENNYHYNIHWKLYQMKLHNITLFYGIIFPSICVNLALRIHTCIAHRFIFDFIHDALPSYSMLRYKRFPFFTAFYSE